MRPPRLTVARLLVAILVLAVVLAAVTQATEFWVGVIATLTTLWLVRAAGHTIRSRGRAGVFWGGYVATGTACLLAAFGPWSDDEYQRKLPTAKLLRAAADAFGPKGRWKFVAYDTHGRPQMTLRTSGRLDVDLHSPRSVPIPAPRGKALELDVQSGGFDVHLRPKDEISGIMIWGGESEHFQDIGQILLALAIAPIGGLLALLLAYLIRLTKRPPAVVDSGRGVAE